MANVLRNSFRHLLPLIVALQMVTFFSSVPVAVAQEASQPVHLHQVFAQEDFLTLTNQARQIRGLAPLKLNDQLVQAAEAKAADMVDKGYWEHFRPGDNKAPWAFIEEAGYDYKNAGENLARGFKTPAGITNAWMASPTHRANLLSTHYTEVGFASVQGVNDNGQPVLITVQMFGSK